MARNASGNWIPLAPVVGGTIITSTWANNMQTSFGADITESLDRSGRGGMLVPFRIADGTKLEPGYSWTAELSTGIYRDLGGADMRVSVAGEDTFRWNANGAQMSLDDGVSWEQVLTNGGGGAQVGVNAGTVQGQTLRWDQDTDQQWQASSALIVDDAGKVGVGTVTPLRKLHATTSWLLGDSEPAYVTGVGQLAIQSTGSIGIQIEAGAASTGYISFSKDDATLAYRITSPADKSLTFNSGDTVERMRINSVGRVGIGTSPGSTSYALTVSATNAGTFGSGLTIVADQNAGASAWARLNLQSVKGVDDFFMYSSGGGTTLRTDTATPMLFATNKIERVRILSSGEVGIGTTSPSAALDVSGNLKLGTIAGGAEGGQIDIRGLSGAPMWSIDSASTDNFRIFNAGGEVAGDFQIGHILANAAGNISLWTNAVARLTIDEGGVVYGTWNNNGVGNAASVFRKLTQAQYDGLTPDADTIYFIVG